MPDEMMSRVEALRAEHFAANPLPTPVEFPDFSNVGSALDDLGPHLLRRIASEPDERDYKLADYLVSDPLRAALKTLTSSNLVAHAVKVWATIATNAIENQPAPPAPTPTPTPTPAPTPIPTPTHDIVWADTDTVLDQGQTGHCVGFGGAQWGNTLPVDDHYANADGHKLYYECKILDGEPNAEDGSDVRTLAKALQNRGRLKAYAFASTIDDVTAFLDKQGPVVFGTDWTNDMFNPAPDGLVRPTGGVAGGHCYLAIGHIASAGRIRFLNSWSDSWGVKGTFEMTIDDAATLLGRQGEAMGAVELTAA